MSNNSNNNIDTTQQDLSLPPDATLQPHSNYKTNLVNLKSNIRIPITVQSARVTKGTRCLVLGRQVATCDVQLKHSSISRRHAVVYYLNELLYVRDIGGKKGTFVNGERVPVGGALVVKHGDVVTFGNAGDELGFRADIQMETEEEHQSIDERGDKRNSSIQNSSFAKDLTSTQSSREQRQAEIAAITASLDEAPTWSTNPIIDIENNDSLVSKSHSTESKNMDITQDAVTKYDLPISYVANLRTGMEEAVKKPNERKVKYVIAAISVDPSGSRVVAGSSSGSVIFWDFGGMDSGHRSFKTIQVDPEIGNQCPLVSLSHSTTGDRFIAATTSAQPRIFDRDGNLIIEFDKGDVYRVDLTGTKGHISEVTGAQWHPLERHIVLTSSIDGSVRTWDLEKGKLHFGKLCCEKVFKIKNKKGQRAIVTCCVFHPGGRSFACGTRCGSIQIWDCDRVTSRPKLVVNEAHHSTCVSSLTFSPDGKYLSSRGYDDDSVSIWQSKKLSLITTYTNITSHHETANCVFSPSSDLVCFGTSVIQGQGSGLIKIFDFLKKDNLNPIVQFEVEAGSSVIKLLWHSRLNQIFCTLSNGSVRVYYDPDISSKGALQSTSKLERKQNALEVLLESRKQPNVGKVITPHALPLFQDTESSTKRKREKELKDPIKTKRPEPASHSKIETGRIPTKGVNFTQFIVKEQGEKSRNIAGIDPREALFKYSEGKNYVSQAYAENTSILAEKTIEQEEEETKEGSRQEK